MSTTLMQAAKQWASRPADERFTSLVELHKHTSAIHAGCRNRVLANRTIEAQPYQDDSKAMVILGPDDMGEVAPTNWSFGQLAKLAGAPAGYLADLPSPIAADCINWGLKYNRSVEEVGVLSYRNGGAPELRAVTGPNYGRIWNNAITGALIEKFGDGITGDWRVPGEFGKDVVVTKANTTLYASDRDLFVFLADEHNRIDVPNRRDGKTGGMARGFFVWNSEVGSTSLGAAFFLFDYACCNRIVWGADQFKEFRIRHTAGAPSRWLEQVMPVLHEYSESKTSGVTQAIAAAQTKKIDDVDAFLAKRFSKKMTSNIKAAHLADENRPIETLWDATTAITAYARAVAYQDDRVNLEREAGKILDMAV